MVNYAMLTFSYNGKRVNWWKYTVIFSNFSNHWYFLRPKIWLHFLSHKIEKLLADSKLLGNINYIANSSVIITENNYFIIQIHRNKQFFGDVTKCDMLFGLFELLSREAPLILILEKNGWP